MKWVGQDSNLRNRLCDDGFTVRLLCRLHTDPSNQMAPAGFEPALGGISVRCLCQLGYGAGVKTIL